MEKVKLDKVKLNNLNPINLNSSKLNADTLNLYRMNFCRLKFYKNKFKVMLFFAVVILTVFVIRTNDNRTTLNSDTNSSNAIRTNDNSTTLNSATNSSSAIRANSEGVVQSANRNLICRYFNQVDFNNSIPNNSISTNSTSNKNEIDYSDIEIAGGIVNHHLLASNLMGEFFDVLAESKNADNVETIIVIAPNHNQKGRYKIGTGLWNWDTAFGTLECDRTLLEEILTDFPHDENFEPFEEEHSISSLVPYIKNYFPKCKIVPIILNGDFNPNNCELLSNRIVSSMKSKKCLVVASIDFSHYLDFNKAQIMDFKTAQIISKRDFEEIKILGNDNIDSPPTLLTLLYSMRGLEKSSHQIINHSNSYKYCGVFDNTTSYYTMIFF